MVSVNEKKTNFFNKLKNISLIKVLQVLLIISITIKTLKNYHEKYFNENYKELININNSHDSFYDMPLTPDARKRELGRAGWILLHNIAIKYPHHPTNKQKEDLELFLSLFGKLFPCEECRPHFKTMLNENPPNFEGHEKFNKWLCRVHNIVNRRIGNRIFDYNKLNNRWDCGCKVE